MLFRSAGIALAALAGMIAAPVSSVFPGMGNHVLIICFVVVVIGGLGSVKGALVASLLIGLVDTFGKVLELEIAGVRVLPELSSMTVYVLMAAILHDTLEDTETTPAELAALFGGEVRDIVMEVTDNKKLKKRKRKELQVKHGPHLTRKARLVKLADKICNLRDVAVNPPARWPLKRQIEYFDWAKAVIDALRGMNISITTTAKSDDEAKALLAAFKFPFRN